MTRKRIIEHYVHRVAPEKPSFDILDWGSQQEQEQRFQVLKEVLSEENVITPNTENNLTVLDVGCGLGDLRGFLEQHVDRLHYVGVDIVEAILREARARHGDSHFVLADVFDAPPFPERSFDVVFCSGVFNLKLGNNEDFAVRALPRLFALCSKCLMVNFLHERTTEKYPHCWYFSPRRLIDSLPAGMRDIRLIDDYLDKDFSILVKRPAL
ncbi:MAG: class I SAM-dependent methyltransferase [Verrucomicrobiota bacterium]